jgi:hypothetical protein
MRTLVESARQEAKSDSSSSRSAEAVRLAKAYLVAHASCEAILVAQVSKTSPSDGDAVSDSESSVCRVCGTRKWLVSIDTRPGMCDECKHAPRPAPVGRKPKAEKAVRGDKGPSKRRDRSSQTGKCPVCLQSVTVSRNGGDRSVAPHTKRTKAGVIDCKGGGKVLSREKTDALDHRVFGSFEGGRRR